MQGRNWKIIVPVIVGILVIIGIFFFMNRKPAGNENFKATDTSTEQITTITETIKPVVAPTPTRRIYHITNPPTEAPTPIPPTPTPNPWQETEYPPTCEEAGYVVRENTLEGFSIVGEGKPALGHEYGEWKKDPETGLMVTTCTRCGKEIRRRTAYEGRIPRIDFSGSMEGISKSERIILKFDFASPTEDFSCFSYTTWQGHNALNYPKKNYTIRLYDDEAITNKHRLTFKGWQTEHKFVLKANYKDTSVVRNLIAANLWAKMAASREHLFETLKHTSNYGAVDGVPVILYLNGEFHGLYTMNLHIDDDLYSMKDDYDAVMIANSSDPEETRFHANAAFINEKDAWEVEYCGTGLENQWAKDKLNELITFVMTSDDETFHKHLTDHLDLDGAIDYLIFLYVTELERNASKDLVLLKYHDCNVWIPTVYDMERAFGLSIDGTAYLDADTFLPVMEKGVWDSKTGSLLWDRLLQLFEPEIRTRYSVLRQTVLEESELIRLAEKYINMIPEEYREADLRLYPRQIPDGRPWEQIKTFIHKRLELLDKVFSKDPATGM